MNEAQRTELRRRLRKYPNVTDEDVQSQIEGYEQRDVEKQVFIDERGFSNAMAEAYLDRAGHSRPPGWHSVFFYPGGNRPRNSTIFWILAITGGVWFIIN